jgi:hypothetical protein
VIHPPAPLIDIGRKEAVSMNTRWIGSIAVLVAVGAAPAVRAQSPGPFVVTSTNAAQNALLVYGADGALRQSIPTGGAGGVSGNAGGIAVTERRLAVVNFGSSSVSVFSHAGGSFGPAQIVATVTPPVSVAFGHDHLYVLGTTVVESHRLSASGVEPAPDGTAALLHADGSAAQIGVAGHELVVSEKSGAVETFTLEDGAVIGAAREVPLAPGANDTPFGLVTRGSHAYVTIAHSDLVALVDHDRILSTLATGVVGGAGQHSPCWITVDGPFLYTSNTPSHSISRLVAAGSRLLIDAPVAAATIGGPFDIAAGWQHLAVLDSDASGTRVSQYAVDGDGTLTLIARTATSASANGIAVVND